MTPLALRLDALALGRPIVERALGIPLPGPSPELVDWLRSTPGPDPVSEPDAWHGRLLGAMAGERLTHPMGWVRILPAFSALVPDALMEHAHREAVGVGALPEAELVAAVRRSIDIAPLDLVAALEAGPLISVKLNHGFWECVTRTAYGDAGLAYYREFDPWPEHVASRFDDLCLVALDRVHRSGLAGPPGEGWLSGPGFSFGLSPRSGDDPAWETLTPPLNANAHGAAVGFLACLRAIDAGVRWHVTDGAAAKQLAWADRVGELAATVARRSDAVLVVGPPHLAGIALTGFTGELEALVMPEQFIHEQWPAVLPLLVGRVAALAERHRRVTVVAQAGAIAALAGIVLALADVAGDEGELRYLDLGQVLDLVVRDDPRVGTWVRKDRVVGRLADGVDPGFTRRG